MFQILFAFEIKILSNFLLVMYTEKDSWLLYGMFWSQRKFLSQQDLNNWVNNLNFNLHVLVSPG